MGRHACVEAGSRSLELTSSRRELTLQGSSDLCSSGLSLVAVGFYQAGLLTPREDGKHRWSRGSGAVLKAAGAVTAIVVA